MKTGKSGDLELTPAAAERLDQNVEFVRQRILREMSRQHSASGYPARASDVDTALNDIGILGSWSRKARSVAWLAAGIAAAGLITALLGQVGRPEMLWPIISAALAAGVASGTALAIVSLEAMRRRLGVPRSCRQFLNAFDSLEAEMRQRSLQLMGAAADSASLGRVISAVELLQLWTPDDSREFRRLLAVRNAIVHEDGRAISSHRIATGLSQMYRLSALLSAGNSFANRSIREVAAHRAARAFTDRVASALRQVGVDVITTHGDAYSDLIIRSGGSAKEIVTRYRKSGPLSVSDITDVVEQSDPNAEIWVVTNATVSPYADEYVQLARDKSGRHPAITIVSWPDDHPQALLDALTHPKADTA